MEYLLKRVYTSFLKIELSNIHELSAKYPCLQETKNLVEKFIAGLPGGSVESLAKRMEKTFSTHKGREEKNLAENFLAEVSALVEDLREAKISFVAIQGKELSPEIQDWVDKVTMKSFPFLCRAIRELLDHLYLVEYFQKETPERIPGFVKDPKSLHDPYKLTEKEKKILKKISENW